jgi:hypothetical protein
MTRLCNLRSKFVEQHHLVIHLLLASINTANIYSRKHNKAWKQNFHNVIKLKG